MASGQNMNRLLRMLFFQLDFVAKAKHNCNGAEYFLEFYWNLVVICNFTRYCGGQSIQDWKKMVMFHDLMLQTTLEKLPKLPINSKTIEFYKAKIL